MNLTAKSSNGRALIELKGSIANWKDTEANFTSQVNELVNAGIKNAHIYINSPGGDCFEANEIVNVIKRFPGKITGEGGSLVASAATYIALHCESFTMPENGMFMIHQASGGAYGRVTELENSIELLRKMNETYYKAYLAKTTMKEEDFKKKWDAGDFWMTGREAKDNGFATEVGAKAAITQAIAQMIAGAGYTGELELTDNSNINHKKGNNMDLTAMCTRFGLEANTTEPQFISMISDWKRKAERVDMLEQREEERLKAEIKELLDKAVLDKRITADQRQSWEETLTDNIDRGKAMLEGIRPVEKPKFNTPKGKQYLGARTFEQMQEEDPQSLAQMQEENPEGFKALYDDYLKRNKLA